MTSAEQALAEVGGADERAVSPDTLAENITAASAVALGALRLLASLHEQGSAVLVGEAPDWWWDEETIDDEVPDHLRDLARAALTSLSTLTGIVGEANYASSPDPER